MAFLGYCLQYMLKINLGIAIVCMVNNTAIASLASSTFKNQTHVLNDDCPVSTIKKGESLLVFIFFCFFIIIQKSFIFY